MLPFQIANRTSKRHRVGAQRIRDAAVGQ